MKVTIIGAGVIGLSSAYYASKKGFDVTVMDSGDGMDNCSWGNAGYISPSHFIPLASPGIVAQGLKWMLSASSPFYIRPKADVSLWKWCWRFYQKATEAEVQKNAPHLDNLLRLSRDLIEDLDRELGGSIGLSTSGCLMLYKKQATGHHEAELAEEAKKLGWEAFVLSAREVQAMEPNVKLDVLGGVFFPRDAHVHPGLLMKSLRDHLVREGVTFLHHKKVTGFQVEGTRVKSVLTDDGPVFADSVVLATGASLPALASQLGQPLLVQPGKGYSVTYPDPVSMPAHPAILVDDRVAMTPLGDALRVGGTMELGTYGSHINMRRVRPIVAAANAYYPELKLEVPASEKVWTGFRPCTPDGLPYLGKVPGLSNAIIAGGHAMIGVSMATGTGLLVSEMMEGRQTTIPMEAFRTDRF